MNITERRRCWQTPDHSFCICDFPTPAQLCVLVPLRYPFFFFCFFSFFSSSFLASLISPCQSIPLLATGRAVWRSSSMSFRIVVLREIQRLLVLFRASQASDRPTRRLGSKSLCLAGRESGRRADGDSGRAPPFSCEPILARCKHHRRLDFVGVCSSGLADFFSTGSSLVRSV